MTEAGRNAGVDEKAARGHISNGMKILACILTRLSPVKSIGKVLAKDRCKFLIQQTCKDTGVLQQYGEFVKGYEK